MIHPQKESNKEFTQGASVPATPIGVSSTPAGAVDLEWHCTHCGAVANYKTGFIFYCHKHWDEYLKKQGY